jgi:uncharacterized repeat protein (TIGR02543 family)
MPLFAAFFCLQTAAHSEAASIVDGLDRTVVVTGADAPGLLGRPVSGIRLYRIRNGGWEPVPFQIDETDGAGTLEGAKNGNLDASDEIVFLQKDTGDEASTDEWPDDAAAKANPRFRLAVTDAARPGWRADVYAFLSSTLPLSGVRYVRYDPGQDLVETDLYQIVHGSSHGFQEILKILPGAGGDNIDFLDKQKLRLKIHIAQVNKDIILREIMDQDVELIKGFSIRVKVGKKRAAAVQNAVVRLNRILVMEIKASGSFLGTNVGFEDSLRFRTVYEPSASWLRIGPIPVPDADEFDPLAVRLSCDWNASASGMKFYNAANSGGILINGKADTPDESLPWPGENGYLVTADPSGSGAVRNASIVGIWDLRGNPPGDSHTIYYKDDSSFESSDTGDKRSYGDFGIQVWQDPMHDTLDVRNTMIYFPSSRTWAEAEAVVSAWTQPPTAAAFEEQRTLPLAVTMDPAGAGTVAVGPHGAAYADSIVTLTATPADGYVFAGWEGDVTGTDNPASLLMDGPKTVTARFIVVSRITVATDPSGLPCNVDGEAYETPVTFDWQAGTRHTLSVDSLIATGEDERLRFAGWSDGAGRVRSVTVGPSDGGLTARFERQFLLTVTVEPPQAGTVSDMPPDGWLNAGNAVRLRALPGPGSAFLGWAGDASGAANPLDVTMNRAKTITARFGNKPPVVTAPDLSFAEDSALILADPMIRTWAADENDSAESLVFRFFPGPALVVDTVVIGPRIRTAASDWNGNETLIVSATDPSGGVGRDTLTVTVTPVPDPPSGFSLLSPAANRVYPEKPDTVSFEWEPASDPDGDAITYVFRMDTTASFSSPRLMVYPGLTEPDLTVAWAGGWGPATYHWTVTASDGTGRETASAESFSFLLDYIDAPASFVLRQNFPNPFIAGTDVEFGLPAAGRARVQIFDIRGRLVRTLADGSFTEGFVTAYWDGCDNDGKRPAAGLYVIRMTAGRFHASRKAVLLP